MNFGQLSARAEAGVHTAGWRLSAVKRMELLIESGQEMTDLYRLYKTREAAPAGQTYVVDLRYAGYEAKGWRVEKAWNWKSSGGHDFNFGLGYSWLDGNRVRAGAALGRLCESGRREVPLRGHDG